MSVRIWLQKGGEVEIARLLKTRVLANLKIQEHHTTGKKYIKLGVSLTDPTEELPQVPQAIVERVTFKGKVYLLGDYPPSSGTLPIGSFHSADMATHMLIDANGTEDGQTSGRNRWCEASITGPSLAAVQKMLYRLISNCWDPYRSRPSHLSTDEAREDDEEGSFGCFKN